MFLCMEEQPLQNLWQYLQNLFDMVFIGTYVEIEFSSAGNVKFK